MAKFEIIEKHITYLTFKIEADTQEEALAKVEELGWDQADDETTEYDNTFIRNKTNGEIEEL